MKGLWIGLPAGFVLGLAAAWLFGSGAPEARAVGQAATTAAEPGAVAGPDAPAERTRTAPASARAPLPPLGVGAPAGEPPTRREAPRAAAGAPEPADVQALRAEVARLRDQLQIERQLRAESEGDAVPPPPDLPADYAEPTLLSRFRAALHEAGVDGEITGIDCTEYPCVVYGELRDDDEKAIDRLGETGALEPYANSANSTSAWGRKTKNADGVEERRTFFGTALYPKEADEGRRTLLGKRLRFRSQQAYEAYEGR